MNALFISLFLPVLLLSSCAHDPLGLEHETPVSTSMQDTGSKRVEKVLFNDERYTDYFRNFTVQKPDGWNWNRDTFKDYFWKSSLIKFMLVNPRTGGSITLRHGDKKSFGLPNYYSLDELELIYESKLIRGGNFDKYEGEYKTKSPCFKKPWMVYYTMNIETVPYNLVVFATFKGELFYIELLTPAKHFKEDLAAFKTIIDTITPVDKAPGGGTEKKGDPDL